MKGEINLMKMEWLKYFIYKTFYLLILIPILWFLNYADAKLIDWFLTLFCRVLGVQELAGLIITAALIIILSLLFIVITEILAKKKIRDKYFPIAPEKPWNQSNKSVHETFAGSEHPNICQCASGASRSMVGMVKLSLPDGELAVMTANIVKRDDGAGLLRLDCQAGKHQQTAAFRINYCPECGGRYMSDSNLKLQEEKQNELENQEAKK